MTCHFKTRIRKSLAILLSFNIYRRFTKGLQVGIERQHYQCICKKYLYNKYTLICRYLTFKLLRIKGYNFSASIQDLLSQLWNLKAKFDFVNLTVGIITFWQGAIYTFSTIFWPIKMSGNTVWPQTWSFQKIVKTNHFDAF